MKEDFRKEDLFIVAFLLCIGYCSAQCENADSDSPIGRASIVCSATYFTIIVAIPSETNPELRDLRVTCRNDTHEKEMDLTENAFEAVQRTSWTDTIPYLIEDTNIVCDVVGCFIGEAGYSYLPRDSCFAEGYSSTSVLSPSTVSTVTVPVPSPFMLELTGDQPSITSEESTPTYASRQPFTTPNEEISSHLQAISVEKGHYYITLLAFPVITFIFILCAMSCIIKQRTDLKRKKEIKLGNWITNDNSHYTATPISVRQAIIHYSESSTTLYSGLLNHNNYLAEPAHVDPTKQPKGNEGYNEYSSKADMSLQATFAAGSEDDTSKCSVYKNNVEALDGIEINPGYISTFPGFLSFKEMERDDQYVVQNRNQDDSEVTALNCELSFIQVDDDIPLGDGSEIPIFPSSSGGYIKN